MFMQFRGWRWVNRYILRLILSWTLEPTGKINGNRLPCLEASRHHLIIGSSSESSEIHEAIRLSLAPVAASPPKTVSGTKTDRVGMWHTTTPLEPLDPNLGCMWIVFFVKVWWVEMLWWLPAKHAWFLMVSHDWVLSQNDGILVCNVIIWCVVIVGSGSPPEKNTIT